MRLYFILQVVFLWHPKTYLPIPALSMGLANLRDLVCLFVVCSSSTLSCSDCNNFQWGKALLTVYDILFKVTIEERQVASHTKQAPNTYYKGAIAYHLNMLPFKKIKLKHPTMFKQQQTTIKLNNHSICDS